MTTKGPERDWVFARRFVIRRMIERGDPSAADRIPDIPEVGALQDEVERLREVAGQHDPTGADHMEEMMEHAQRADSLRFAIERALDDIERGRQHDAEDILRRALVND